MQTQNDTRQIVEGYFNAWTTQNVDAAYALLADDLKFSGPSARYTTAAEFRPGLEKFSAMTRSVRMIDLLIDGDRASMLYDCELQAVGTVRIASFFRVAQGKISTYETLFDPTEFLRAAQQKN